MSGVFFISDLHLQHKNILKFAGEYRKGETVDQHDQWLIDSINSRVEPRDKLFIMGDVAFSLDGLARLEDLLCKNLVLIKGNHDNYPMSEYLKYFTEVHGLMAYKKFWLSHAPIHPCELRGRKNIHGHVHQNTIDDDNYINVCVEKLHGLPVSLDELRGA